MKRKMENSAETEVAVKKSKKVKDAKEENKKGKENEKDEKKLKKETTSKTDPKDGKVDKKADREKQKKLKNERQAKKKKDLKVFELGVQAKKVWENARSSSCSKEEKPKLINELHELLKGQMLKVIHAHDTARVVEFLMAEGDEEIKQKLFDELKDELLGLAKSKYAVFFVQKMLKYGTKDQKGLIMKSFQGKVSDLTKHKVANAVVECCFNEVATASQRNSFVQEFFGPEFRLCKEPESRTVLDILAKHPEKEKVITRSLNEHVNILITKGCYNHSLVHTVLWNYMLLLNHQIAKAEDEEKKEKVKKARSEFIGQLRDVCVHVLHSQDGARLSMNAMWHGNAKDRKSIIKSFKTFIPKICNDEYGHMVLLASFDCVDDTKLLAKAVMGELATKQEGDGDDGGGTLGDVLSTDFGRKTVTYLLVGRDRTYFHPDYLALLEQGDGNDFSKKDPDIRRKEMAEAAQPALFKFLAQNLFGVLSSEKLGPCTIFLQAVLNAELTNHELAKPVLQRMAEISAEPFEPSDEGLSLMENSAFNRLLKKVIGHDKLRLEKAAFTFSSMLVEQLESRGSLTSLLKCNRGTFVLVFLVETGIEEVVNKLKKILSADASKKLIKEAKFKGAEILSKKLPK